MSLEAFYINSKKEIVSADELESLGVFHWELDHLQPNQQEELDHLCKKLGFKGRHFVCSSEMTQLNKSGDVSFEEIPLKGGEIFFFLEGGGYLDIRHKEEWIRLVCSPGSTFVLPPGITHRFVPKENDVFRFMRLVSNENVSNFAKRIDRGDLTEALNEIDPHLGVIPFPFGEYLQRISNVRRLVQQTLGPSGVVLITEPENLFYLIGFQSIGDPSVQALGIHADRRKESFMVTRKLEKSNIDHRTFLSRRQRKSYADFEDPMDCLLGTIKKFVPPQSIIGFEERTRRSYWTPFLSQNLPEIQISEKRMDVGMLRVVKSQLELEKTEEAARITLAGMRAMMGATCKGTWEHVIAASGYYAMFSEGSTFASYPIFVSSGPHGALGHAFSQTREIGEGELVFLELTGVKDRYCAPIMRTVWIGDSLPRWVEILSEGVSEAVSLSIAAMKHGTPACEVDRINRSLLAKCGSEVTALTGYKVTQLARSGYSVGVGITTDWGEGELFSLSPSEERPLQEGMVFHLIPWLQVFDKNKRPVGGVGLSETVRVGKEGGVSIFGEEIPRRILPVSPSKVVTHVPSHLYLGQDTWAQPKLQLEVPEVPEAPSAAFLSDNCGGIHPNVLEEMTRVNKGPAPAYGNDLYTSLAVKRVKQFFEKAEEMWVGFTSTGTSANVLLLSLLPCDYSGAVICHARSHLNVDECGAPERAGLKLLGIESPNGKISPHQICQVMDCHPPIVHRTKPFAVSISQPTEKGTVYTIPEIKAISEVCRQYNLALHVDGSRFFNAGSALGVSLSQMTTEVGVDLLSLGFSKNGAMDAEAMIVFNLKMLKGNDPNRILKQGTHLKSKMRYLSAQVTGMLNNSTYLTCATHANRMAKKLSEKFLEWKKEGVRLSQPVETNTLLVEMPNEVADKIKPFYSFVPWEPGKTSTVFRFVTCWETPEEEVEKFGRFLKTI